MNIRDIARLANVTPGTVSKVLNNYPDISENTRRHVMKIIEENQYIPRNSARSLKLAVKIPQIALAMEGIADWLHQAMAKTLFIRFHNADYTVMSFHDNYYSQDKVEKFQELLNYIDKHNLTGMVYFGGDFRNVPSKYFESLSCPVVFVNTVLPDQTGTEAYSSVQVDHYGTAARQMEYLITKGHRNICTVISSTIDTSAYGIRRDAYKDVLRRHGLEHNLAYIQESHYLCSNAYQLTYSCLKAHPKITAVCCFADAVAIAAVKAIRDAGRAPGKDVAIISFDGMEHLQYCIPSITTFEQPEAEMMDYVYDLILGLMNSKRQHLQITLQTKFQENESCLGEVPNARPDHP